MGRPYNTTFPGDSPHFAAELAAGTAKKIKMAFSLCSAPSAVEQKGY